MNNLRISILFFFATLHFASSCTQISSPGTGTVSSPNNPSNYGNSVNICWQITAPAGATITVTFTTFNTESCCDHVYCRSGTSNSSPQIGGRISGYQNGATRTSTGNTMYIRFTSDFSVTRSGFRANVVFNLPPTTTTTTTAAPTTTEEPTTTQEPTTTVEHTTLQPASTPEPTTRDVCDVSSFVSAQIPVDIVVAIDDSYYSVSVRALLHDDTVYIMPGMTAEQLTFPHQFNGEQVWVVESMSMSNDTVTDTIAVSFAAQISGEVDMVAGALVAGDDVVLTSLAGAVLSANGTLGYDLVAFDADDIDLEDDSHTYLINEDSIEIVEDASTLPWTLPGHCTPVITTLPPEQPEDSEGFPLWIIGVIIGALLLVVVLIIVIVCLKKKKNDENRVNPVAPAPANGSAPTATVQP